MSGILLPVCSIFFSGLLCIVYFLKERINIIENKMFTNMLICSFFDSVFVSILQFLALNGVIGIEKYSGVIARAIKKYPDKLDNLRIINMDAKNLTDVFNREIETIYLNFSDPWPKKRHASRRLTSAYFLEIYDNVFKSAKRIVQKTDNLILFQSSLVSLSQYGYTFLDVNLDLANSDIPNILTEYEAKFIKDGVKINYLEAIKK